MSRTQKLVALFLLCVFSAETVFANALTFESKPVPAVSLPSQHSRLDKFLPGPKGLVVHLQTVHGNYEAEQHLYQTLRYLHKKYGVDLILTEGSSVPLKSDLLQFSSNPKLNAKLLDLLATQGLVKAPELFLADFPDTPAIGIENAAHYRSNLESFLKVKRSQNETRAFLSFSRQNLLEKASILFDSSTKNFFRQYFSFEENILPLQAWLEILYDAARRRLGMDLTSRAFQYEWPMLTRYFFLKSQNPSAGKAPEKELASLVESTAFSSSDITHPETFLFNPLTRFFLKNESKQKAFPIAKSLLTRRFLTSEMDSSKLIEEMERLFSLLEQKMAETQEQKDLVQNIREYHLLKKFLGLSLSRREWDALPIDKWSDNLRLSTTFEAARSFYKIAVAREKAMDKKIRRSLQTHSPKITVLITGGFHAASLEQIIRRENYSYLLASPLILSHETSLYEKSIRMTALETPATAAMETVPYFALNRTELRAHGVDPKKIDALLANAIQAVSRSETRASEKPASRPVSEELRLAGTIIYHYPKKDDPNDPYVQIEALLATLYGGDVQYYQRRSQKKNGIIFEQVRVEGLQGLLEMAKPRSSVSYKHRQQAAALAQEAFKALEHLGIRAQQEVRLPGYAQPLTIGEILGGHSDFENSFLQTFLGSRKGNIKGRLQNAMEIGGFPAELGNKARYFDHVFQMRFPDMVRWEGKNHAKNGLPAEFAWFQPYAIRAQHGDSLKPHKGGIRNVDKSLLERDGEYIHQFELLTQAGLNIIELRYHLRKYVKEETLPLSFGMSLKAYAAGLPYNGGKGAWLTADIFPSKNGVGFEILNLGDLYVNGPKAFRELLENQYAAILYQAGFIGPHKDIPAGDMGTGSVDMDGMANELVRIQFRDLNQKEKMLLPEALRTTLEEAQRKSQHQNDDRLFLKAVTEYFEHSAQTDATLEGPAKELLHVFREIRSTFTGKRVALSGSYFRDDATGYGGVHVLKHMLRLEVENRGGGPQALSSIVGGREISTYDASKPLKNLTAKVVGFGNAGGWAVRQLLKEEALVTAISEGPSGVVYKPEGFTESDIAWLAEIKKSYGGFLSLDQHPEAIVRNIVLISEDDFLEEATDVYVLAALQSHINAKNVERAAGWIFLEIANGGITQEAYEKLSQWSLVFSDSIANAGGVIVSYFEWMQNITGDRWSEAFVIQQLEETLASSVQKINAVRQDLSKKQNRPVDLRTAIDVNYLREISEPPPYQDSNASHAAVRSEDRMVLDFDTIHAATDLLEGFEPLSFHKASESTRKGEGALGSKTPKIAVSIPTSPVLRSKLGLQETEAYLVGKSFAMEYGALPILRKITGDVPVVIVTNDPKDLNKIAEVNNGLKKQQQDPLLTAPTVEAALRLMGKTELKAEEVRRYAGLLSVDDVQLMTALPLKKDYKIDWLVKTRGEFDHFISQNNLQSWVDAFRSELRIKTSA